MSYINTANSSNRYMQFIYEGIDKETDSFYRKKSLSSILGSKDFITNTLAKIKEQYKIPYSPDIKCTKYQPEMDTILETVTNYFRINQARLNDKTPGKKNLEKMIAIYLSSHLGQLTHSKIAAHFSLCSESIGAILKRCTELLLTNNEFKNHLNILIQKLCG